ncbi:MAG TPA: PTS galactitol transporter subunit IIC, partial [Eubacteriaceae bacterium]|nr:PTS galactitol transporter subunit IIC [Eubacteriaceae bacterium]
LFASAFSPLTEASKRSAKKSGKQREWFLAVNDAVGYGESNTLITGILLIPIMVGIAVILPGNQTLPVVDLIALPYMVQIMISSSNGNIFKSVIGGAVYFSIGLLICTYTAPMFTDVAASVGVAIPAAGLMITSFGILNNPTMGLLF